MKKSTILFLLCLPALIAGEQTLMPLGPADLGADEPVIGPVAKAKRTAPAEPGATSWALEADQALDLSPQPHITASRGYWMRVESADFDRGISLKVTGPGALVRLSPIPDSDGTIERIDSADLVLISAAGEAFSGERGIDRFVEDAELNKAGNRLFSAGTAVFRISDAVGAGELTLFAENLRYDAGRRYTIDVFERDSEIRLELGTARDTYLAGTSMTFATAFFNGEDMVLPSALSARLIAPDGRDWDLPVTLGAAKQRARLDMPAATRFGLWEIEVTAEAEIDGAVVRRDARTAFAYNQPTAVFRGDVQTALDAAGLRAELGLRVAVAGNYEVRGVLFGTDAEGASVPLAVGIASAPFETGAGSIDLRFEQAVLEASGLRAPFVVKDLRLIHQDAMAILHRQENGFRITGDIVRQ